MNCGKSKEENQNQEAMHFENAIYRVLHERCNNTAFFAEHQKFQEKVSSTNVRWVNSGILK